MKTSPLRLRLLQVPLAWESPAANIEAAGDLMPDPGSCDLVVLPEMWSTGFTMRPGDAAEPDRGPAWQWMADVAQRTGSVICGSLAVAEDGRFYNRFHAVGPQGPLAQYDKKHLFTYSGEDKSYTAGTARVTFTLNGWRIMPVICYDIRFPAWCRNTMDYDVLLVVANWPAARIHHWDALLRARAIENQCYVVAVNRTGTDGNGLAYPGHTAVYDMNGEAVLFAGDGEGAFDAALDADALAAFRTRFPFLADRDPLHGIPS
jgi:predicted amidohydrolase